LPWKALFVLSGPSSREQRSENMFALRPPFLLGANGRKRDRYIFLEIEGLQSKQMALAQTI
jgi:hypothetical protein